MRRVMRSGLALLAMCAWHSSALAQPVNEADKVAARALMQNGLELLRSKDYQGALAAFTSAYRKFQSAKILLNVATTQSLLQRHADAANTYQQYLDAPDTDASKHAEIRQVLAELDRSVGTLHITTATAATEVSISGQPPIAVTDALRWRVPVGSFAITATHAGYRPFTRSGQVRAGQTTAIAIALVPQEPSATESNTSRNKPSGDAASPPANRSSTSSTNDAALGDAHPGWGVFARAHVDALHVGAAGLVGGYWQPTSQVRIALGGLWGPTLGGYLGATAAVTHARLRPALTVALPWFWSEGPRFAVRGALGLQAQLTPRFGVSVEVGGEYLLNAEPARTTYQLVPAAEVRIGW